jgi:hypothetical protein
MNQNHLHARTLAVAASRLKGVYWLVAAGLRPQLRAAAASRLKPKSIKWAQQNNFP